MTPSGLAVIIGAGPNTVSRNNVTHTLHEIWTDQAPQLQGTGIARILSHPSHGNLAVALLARRVDSLAEIKENLQQSSPESVIETFPTNTDPYNLRSTFRAIGEHKSFKGLKLTIAVYSIKHLSKKPFLAETYEEFTKSLEVYVGGGFAFAQEALRLFFDHHGTESLSDNGRRKKGTLIFTGTLGALRCSAEYAAYGAGRAGV
jgi:NAD(P)-dependent dehydrogenase (short-subunit alcohol dehydrogenase family)